MLFGYGEILDVLTPKQIRKIVRNCTPNIAVTCMEYLEMFVPVLVKRLPCWVQHGMLQPYAIRVLTTFSDKTMHPTFARVGGSAATVILVAKYFFHYFDWTRFVIVIVPYIKPFLQMPNDIRN